MRGILVRKGAPAGDCLALVAPGVEVGLNRPPD